MQTFSERHYLTPLFEPDSVAVIGASDSPGNIGGILYRNMREAGYKGNLYAVNPAAASVDGQLSFPDVSRLPQRVDLAIIATPAGTVPDIIEACGHAGVRTAVVISAGFSEIGPQGEALERALLENARRHGMRIAGPNCLGLMRPSIGLNATFAGTQALAGGIGLVSQSGALCTALLDWARPSGVGFSSVISLGASRDVDFGEVLDYLVNDPRTEHILLYIEGIRDARRFMSALRAAARIKPVILMKVGRHASGTRAVASHTGALVGADDVFDAAIRRAGVVRVQSVGQMVAAAQALSSHVRPRGDRLAILTNGGGPGVMAADRAADLGIPLAALSSSTQSALRTVLPAHASLANPVDMIGDAGPERYAAAVRACLADPGVDGLLVILTPQAMTKPTEAARAVIDMASQSDKPLLSCWMGGEQVAAARSLFEAVRIPALRTPEPAVELFAHVSSFHRNQQLLLETPGPLSEQQAPDLDGAHFVIDAALAEHRTVLSEMESKALLAAFHIPIAPAVRASSSNEAVLIAQEFGYPVALKIDSPDITHKTDAGGVRLGLANAPAVHAAFQSILDSAARNRPQARVLGVIVEPMIQRRNGRELMLGVARDSVFGPVISFGSGGTAVEVLADRAVALPPLNGMLAEDLIRSTRASRLLGAFRNMPPANMAALTNVMLRVSEMACELPALVEMDINPLIVDESGVVAADARVVIEAPRAQRGRYGHMAIHPYPSQWVSEWRPQGGGLVSIRPIRPEDAQMEQAFVKGLSPESRFFRFMNTLRELTPDMLVRFTQIDYDREMAFVAITRDGGVEQEIGVCRYITNPDGESCEFAIVVADAWQKQGLGRRMLTRLIETASARGLKTMTGQILAANHEMLALTRALGFTISDTDEPTVKHASLPLPSP
jgi:acetyltransferase